MLLCAWLHPPLLPQACLQQLARARSQVAVSHSHSGQRHPDSRGSGKVSLVLVPWCRLSAAALNRECGSWLLPEVVIDRGGESGESSAADHAGLQPSCKARVGNHETKQGKYSYSQKLVLTAAGNCPPKGQ